MRGAAVFVQIIHHAAPDWIRLGWIAFIVLKGPASEIALNT